MAEQLAIPEILDISKDLRVFTQIFPDDLQSGFIQRGGTPSSLALLQARKTPIPKTPHPILNRTWTLPKEARHLVTTESRTDQQNTVQSMVVTRFLGAMNLLLNRDSHKVRILDFQFSHEILLSANHILAKRGLMRKYL